MSAPIALLTSQLTHGARMITASSDRYVNGIGVARLGDLVMCPRKGHGLNSIISVSINQVTDSKPLAHVGARAACGAIIITGSPNVYVG